MTPSPTPRHQTIVKNLLLIIDTFLHTHSSLGTLFFSPCDVVFSQKPPQVVVPDLVFVSKAHSAIVTEKNIQGFRTFLSRSCPRQRPPTTAG